MKDVIDLSLPVDIYNLQGNLISDSVQISFYAYIYIVLQGNNMKNLPIR